MDLAANDWRMEKNLSALPYLSFSGPVLDVKENCIKVSVKLTNYAHIPMCNLPVR